jgi:hypothetical protein
MDERGEVCRVYVLRKRDSAEWERLAARDETANLCILAAGKFYRLMAKEPSWCGCCDSLFAQNDAPQAFIVLLPIERDSKNLTARAFAVCAECDKQEDQWLIDQTLVKSGLAPTKARLGHSIH